MEQAKQKGKPNNITITNKHPNGQCERVACETCTNLILIWITITIDINYDKRKYSKTREAKGDDRTQRHSTQWEGGEEDES